MGNSNTKLRSLPDHWKLSEEYSTIPQAVAGLQNHAETYKLIDVVGRERQEVEDLLHITWDSAKVGLGKNARNLDHTQLQIRSVSRIENPRLLESYMETRRKMVRNAPQIQPLAKGARGCSEHVLTGVFLLNVKKSVLKRNMDMKINEHYLFHGTKEDNVGIIVRDGLDNRFSSDSAMLGRGMYTAESSTKADQYTDHTSDRTDGLKNIILVRVLLGNAFINADLNPPKFRRPPCTNCQQVRCDCPHTSHYDSVIDDAGRLFREFVVYDKSQCYPEYIITYKRVHDANEAGPSGAQVFPSLPTEQGVVMPAQVTLTMPNATQLPSEWWNGASGVWRVLPVLSCLVLCITLILSLLMIFFGLFYNAECPGSRFVPGYTFVMGLLMYTVFLLLPFMFLDWCGPDTALLKKRSFRITLTLAAIITFVFQLSGWVVVFKDWDTFPAASYCHEVLAGFARVSTVLLIVLYILLPISIYVLLTKARPLFKQAMKWVAYLSKATLVVAVFAALVMLPVCSVVAGGIATEKCPALSPKLPAYLLGSGICLCLIISIIVLALVCYCNAEDTDSPCGGSYCFAGCLAFCLLLSQLAFQIVGYTVVYRNKLGTDVSPDSGAANYCSGAIYTLAFGALTFTTMLYFYAPTFLYIGIKDYSLPDAISKRLKRCF